MGGILRLLTCEIKMKKFTLQPMTIADNTFMSDTTISLEFFALKNLNTRGMNQHALQTTKSITITHFLLIYRGSDDSSKQEFSSNVPEQVISRAVFVATCDIRRISGKDIFLQSKFYLLNFTNTFPCKTAVRGERNKEGTFSLFSSFLTKACWQASAILIY